LGNHSLKAGVSFQAIRFFYRYAPSNLGNYYFTGLYTSDPAVSATTGSGIADFLADQMNTGAISNAPNVNDAQWYDSFYLQDDWKVTRSLTLNLGVRYDYYQPFKENSGSQENFIPDFNSLGIATGSGTVIFPRRFRHDQPGTVYPGFWRRTTLEFNIDNERLTSGRLTNFAPRVGIAYQLDPLQ
jgi:outer membrane receptor protein involved in Fe transport